MVVNFTELLVHGHKKNYSWWFESFTVALDVLSNLTAKGRHILHAEFIENDQRFWVPLDVLDGGSFSVPFQQLEKQWKTVLDNPISTPAVS
ncbi:hypothetical protein GCM10027085_03790 [Spirosoma aerophilum]